VDRHDAAELAAAVDPDLAARIRFIYEIDALKQELRQALLADGSRRENSAEHSWHLAMMALVLGEHASEEVDLSQVLRMVLVHDIVECDAGDTFVYSRAGSSDWQERERQAAERIFGLLPAEQGSELRALWEEYEAQATPEARFARSLDRLMPLMHNYHTQGRAWREHGVTRDQVLGVNSCIAAGSSTLWDHAHSLIEDAVARGYLQASPETPAPGEPGN
jgi:putative hydrolase of HD superfamily